MHETLFNWFNQHETLLLFLGSLSVLSFFGTLAILPYLVIRIPADYFHRRHAFMAQLRTTRPTLRWTLFFLKNLLGAIVFTGGMLMLIMPGQGLITMAIGMMLMNFPGKFAVERWIVSRRGILRAINWMRARSAHPPLTLPEQGELEDRP